MEAAGQWLKNNWRGHEFKAAKDGAIFFYGHPADNPQHVAMVELRCGTDFVARTDEFKALGHELALQVVGGTGDKLEDLKDQVYIRDTSRKISDLLAEYSQKLGETISVNRWIKWSVGGAECGMSSCRGGVWEVK